MADTKTYRLADDVKRLTMSEVHLKRHPSNGQSQTAELDPEWVENEDLTDVLTPVNEDDGGDA